MLVSTARMTLSNILSFRFVQFFESPPFWRAVGKQRPVNVLECILSAAPHDDLVAAFIPLQDRTGAYAKLLSNTGRDRNLPLRRHLRTCECHALYYHG